MTDYEYKTVSRKEAQILLKSETEWQLTAVKWGDYYFKRELPNPFATITNRGPG
jgi:hypothetical protein